MTLRPPSATLCRKVEAETANIPEPQAYLPLAPPFPYGEFHLTHLRLNRPVVKHRAFCRSSGRIPSFYVSPPPVAVHEPLFVVQAERHSSDWNVSLRNDLIATGWTVRPQKVSDCILARNSTISACSATWWISQSRETRDFRRCWFIASTADHTGSALRTCLKLVNKLITDISKRLDPLVDYRDGFFNVLMHDFSLQVVGMDYTKRIYPSQPPWPAKGIFSLLVETGYLPCLLTFAFSSPRL